MHNLLKSAALGTGLLVAVAATGYAQSVSSLPPTGPATTATTAPVASSNIYPYASNGTAWTGLHYQASTSNNDRAQRPYSTRDMGPKPN